MLWIFGNRLKIYIPIRPPLQFLSGFSMNGRIVETVVDGSIKFFGFNSTILSLNIKLFQVFNCYLYSIVLGYLSTISSCTERNNHLQYQNKQCREVKCCSHIVGSINSQSRVGCAHHLITLHPYPPGSRLPKRPNAPDKYRPLCSYETLNVPNPSVPRPTRALQDYNEYNRNES